MCFTFELKIIVKRFARIISQARASNVLVINYSLKLSCVI